MPAHKSAFSTWSGSSCAVYCHAKSLRREIGKIAQELEDENLKQNFLVPKPAAAPLAPKQRLQLQRASPVAQKAPQPVPGPVVVKVSDDDSPKSRVKEEPNDKPFDFAVPVVEDEALRNQRIHGH